MAYSTILLGNLSSSHETTPEETRAGGGQRRNYSSTSSSTKDGTWPPEPSFISLQGRCETHIVSNTKCWFSCFQPRPAAILSDYVDKLANAASSLKRRAFRLKSGALAWASGHHPQSPGPESWSTASVYHFLYQLERLQVRKRSGNPSSSTSTNVTRSQRRPKKERRVLKTPEEFLDCDVWDGTKKISLKSELWKFLEPIAMNASAVQAGRSFPRGTKISAIFYGPPGTSKTELVKKIAEFLGWPHLSIDPSHLVKFGMDRVQAEANTVFSMLAAAEQIVVLLDEFDEMVREQARPGDWRCADFLTTAMLPKLTLINKQRRIVFILATNHVEQFDFAISRMGRFDRMIQIMPPTAAEKRRK